MATEVKRLYPARDERIIGGVCSGLTKYLPTDPGYGRICIIAHSGCGHGRGRPSQRRNR
jgi:phage shock protein PspC (stress-responsive transcriptional regulator)